MRLGIIWTLFPSGANSVTDRQSMLVFLFSPSITGGVLKIRFHIYSLMQYEEGDL